MDTALNAGSDRKMLQRVVRHEHRGGLSHGRFGRGWSSPDRHQFNAAEQIPGRFGLEIDIRRAFELDMEAR